MRVLKEKRRELDEDERRLLILALAEAKARKLVIRAEDTSYEDVWAKGSSGYFTRNDGKPYNPSGQQEGLVKSVARFAAFIGSRGSGKTAAGAQKALAKIERGETGAVLNPSFENFKISTWPEFSKWIPWSMIVPSQRYRSSLEWELHKPFTLVFMNGAKVYCKGLRNISGARGPNINWLWFDEGQEDLEGLAWKIAIASVRVGKDPQAWTTATPRGRDHWLYKFFEMREIPEDAIEAFEKSGTDKPLMEVFHGTIRDNEKNLDPEFMASLLATYPVGWLRAQEIEGKFVDEGGILGDPAWFKGKVIPLPPTVVRARMRYWDLAATEKKISGKKRNDPDETVGTLMSWDGVNKYIEDQVGGYWAWKKIKEIIVEVAKMDGPYVPIRIEQEPGAGGKNSVAEIASTPELAEYSVQGHKPEGDKIARANTWFAEAALGQVFLVHGTWNEPFLSQLSSFPGGRHDDRIDSVSGARLCVAPIRAWKTTQFMHV